MLTSCFLLQMYNEPRWKSYEGKYENNSMWVGLQVKYLFIVLIWHQRYTRHKKTWIQENKHVISRGENCAYLCVCVCVGESVTTVLSKDVCVPPPPLQRAPTTADGFIWLCPILNDWSFVFQLKYSNWVASHSLSFFFFLLRNMIYTIFSISHILLLNCSDLRTLEPITTRHIIRHDLHNIIWLHIGFIMEMGLLEM